MFSLIVWSERLTESPAGLSFSPVSHFPLQPASSENRSSDVCKYFNHKGNYSEVGYCCVRESNKVVIRCCYGSPCFSWHHLPNSAFDWLTLPFSSEPITLLMSKAVSRLSDQIRNTQTVFRLIWCSLDRQNKHKKSNFVNWIQTTFWGDFYTRVWTLWLDFKSTLVSHKVRSRETEVH